MPFIFTFLGRSLPLLPPYSHSKLEARISSANARAPRAPTCLSRDHIWKRSGSRKIIKGKCIPGASREEARVHRQDRRLRWVGDHEGDTHKQLAARRLTARAGFTPTPPHPPIWANEVSNRGVQQHIIDSECPWQKMEN